MGTAPSLRSAASAPGLSAPGRRYRLHRLVLIDDRHRAKPPATNVVELRGIEPPPDPRNPVKDKGSSS